MNAKSVWEAVAGKSRRSEAAFAELDAAYRAAGRAYHSWQHILECLDHLNSWEAVHGATDPAIRFAIFYHDAIYEPGSADNEARSVELATKRLVTLRAAPELAQDVRELILATAHTAPGVQPSGSTAIASATRTARNLIVDIDLAILGADPDRFLEYDEQIRLEYRMTPAGAFARARARLLAAFLARDRIYLTGFFHDRLESRARVNLTRLLHDVYAG